MAGHSESPEDIVDSPGVEEQRQLPIDLYSIQTCLLYFADGSKDDKDKEALSPRPAWEVGFYLNDGCLQRQGSSDSSPPIINRRPRGKQKDAKKLNCGLQLYQNTGRVYTSGE